MTVSLTIWLGIRAILHLRKADMHWDSHSISGVAILATSLVPLVTGVSVVYMVVWSKWKTKLLVKLKKWHKWFGYCLIFVSFIAVQSGIYYYFQMVDPSLAVPLTALNGLSTILLFTVFEIRYRLSLKSPL